MNVSISALIETVNQCIEITKVEEKQSAAMASFIQQNIQHLHGSIAIHSKTPETALLQFVFGYIDSAPSFLKALDELANEAGIEDYTHSFLQLACTYFINPPDILSAHAGIYNMLCRAYLAHRLMEEVNDLIMHLGGAPLAPMDMSMANIITHALLGDELANQLDHLVLLSVETADADKGVFEKRNVRQFLEKRRLKNWHEVLKRWPCFTKDCAIDLQMGS